MFLDDRLLPYGVYGGQQLILEYLWREDGLTPGELARRMGVETPTITRAAQRMELAGLVRRLPDPEDARLVRIFLRERGRELQALLPAVLGTAVDEMLEGLSAEERAELVRLLAHVRRNLAGKKS
ncbi:MarR family transcriptional regulator [Ktedonosporobacter rubrisoli]|uniref:MarR family transcriptional regulator n=2 Tax=Ktedonosporobacter rubrisoli TaxID=2509675 RepID=A0A4V0Z0I8_KTERU|nr:MarR family transcriptional regulator [Ktedonosporobacter rubrisoli]